MKAVIPAAGEGKRFNKDSTYMHKCLVPINGKALLLYTLENLTNIKEITEELKIKDNGGKRIVIAYLSIGEAEDYRYYWNKS